MRILIAVAALAMLAACTQPRGAISTTSPFSPQERLALRFVGAEVDVSGVKSSAAGRDVPQDMLARILDEEAARSLHWTVGSRAGVVVVEMERVDLLSAGQAIMVGGASFMKGRTRMLDAATGQPLTDWLPIEVRGGGYELGGLLGAAMIQERELELRGLSRNFMEQVRRTYLGG